MIGSAHLGLTFAELGKRTAPNTGPDTEVRHNPVVEPYRVFGLYLEGRAMNELMPAEQLESLVITLYDIGAVRFGKFQLHSGRTSPIYIDLRILPSYPDALRQAAAAYQYHLNPLNFDLIAATPLAGLPIATAICLDLNVPLIYPRKRPKKYGTGKHIEGKWDIGQTVAVVDDLITSGDSLLKGIALLKASGLHVTDGIVLIDREQGGRESVQEQGYNLHSIMTLSQLLAVLERTERITSKRRVKVLRALSK